MSLVPDVQQKHSERENARVHCHHMIHISTSIELPDPVASTQSVALLSQINSVRGQRSMVARGFEMTAQHLVGDGFLNSCR